MFYLTMHSTHFIYGYMTSDVFDIFKTRVFDMIRRNKYLDATVIAKKFIISYH